MKSIRLRTTMASLLVAALFSAVVAPPAQTQTLRTLWTWGSDPMTGTNEPAPVQISFFNGAAAVAPGRAVTLVLRPDGTVWAWGDNSLGQLGNGTAILGSVTPVQVSLSNVTSIAAGPISDHCMAVKQDGTVWAWGNNDNGALGNGASGSGLFSNVPVQVSGLTNPAALAGGYVHSLALKQDGTVWAWGYGGFGSLGNVTYDSSNVPVPVGSVTNVAAIAAGNANSLALKKDGTVWAWGYGGDGDLGNGTGGDGTYMVNATPTQVSNLTDITAIAAGNDNGWALKKDGTVWAWGYNGDGELGNGTGGDQTNAHNSNLPVQVSGLTKVVAISGGASHCLALEQDGSVWAWGDNGWSELGAGLSGPNSNVPVRVTGLTGITSIAGGPGSSFALKTLTGPGAMIHNISVTPASSSVAIGTPVTFTVTANMHDGASIDVTEDPATTYQLTHGVGVLTGNSYVSNRTEAAVITISYTDGPVTAYNAAYVNETYMHGRIVSSSLSPATSTVFYPSPVTFTFTVNFADGSTSDVSLSPNTTFKIQHGVGTLAGNTYTSARSEAAVIAATYVDNITGQTINQAAYVNEAAPVTLKKISASPYSFTVFVGEPIAFNVTATFSDGSTQNVSTDPATSYSIGHGFGTLTGRMFTPSKRQSGWIDVQYTYNGVTASNVIYVTAQ